MEFSIKENGSSFYNNEEIVGEHKVARANITFNDVIPDDLLKLIKKEITNLSESEYETAKVGNGTTDDNSFHDESVRISEVNWLGELNWISSIFHHYMTIANREIWQYDITGCQAIQVTKYTKNGHYTWHCDYGTSDNVYNTRKLSASLLISDPNDYVGGKFQVIDYHGKIVSIPKKMGQITFFDSRIPHRVAPVLKGERISLVAWFTGPKLR